MNTILDYKLLGKRIAKRRGILGLNQATVNEMAGLSDKYLSHIETGRTTPSIETLMQICIALDVTPDYILLGSLKNPTYFDEHALLLQKIKGLKSSKQLELLDSFVDWLIDQKI